MAARAARALIATLVVALSLTFASAAHAQTDQTDQSGTSTLTLTQQTPWVDPVAHAIFDLKVAVVSPLPPTDVTMVVDVYSRLVSRSDFDRTMTPNYAGYVIAQPIKASLADLHPDAHGVITVDIPVTSSSGKGQNVLRLPQSGTYPVGVELRSGGDRIARLVTTLLYTSAPPSGPRLNVAWVVPIAAPLPDPAGNGAVTPAEDATLTTLVDALGAHPSVPAALQVSPDTLAGLDHSDPGLVNLIGRALTNREVMTGTWVPMSLAAMISAGLADQISLSLTRSTDQLTADLGTNVAGRTWVENGPIDQDALSFLRGAQFDRVVLPDRDLTASSSRFTVAQPFVVEGADRTLIRAAEADSGLEAHFFNGGDQVLAAHQLLGDLNQIYSDAPSDTRGVVVVTPPDWVPNAAFLSAFLTGLEQSPTLVGIQLDSFFDAVPSALGNDGQPLVRQVVTDETAISNAAADLFPSIQTLARSQLDSLATALPDDATVYPHLERLLLEAPDESLAAADRRARLTALNSGIGAATRLIAIGGPRTVTLTARTGRLPLDIISQLDEPVRVQVRIESDKLQLPGAGNTGRTSITQELHKGDNTFDLTVEARTPGAFAVAITVLTADGNLVMTQSRLTVQSTALSGVGIILSVGAALFLIVWWARHTWRAGKGSHTRHRGT